MRAVSFRGHRVADVVEVPTPVPGPGEVLVQMKASGICGSDLHRLYRPSPDDLRAYCQARGLARLQVPGHEPCGVVAALGQGVQQVAVGDRVIVAMRGGYGWSRDGSDQDRMVARAEHLVPLPEGMSYEEGAYASCSGGTAFLASRRLALSGLDTVAVFGLGPVGLAGVTIATGLGAKVIGVDPSPGRRHLAQQMGAAEVVDPQEGDPARAILDLTGGKGADAAADYSGSTQGRLKALECLRRWGRLVLVGERNEFHVPDPDRLIIHKRVTIYGSATADATELTELRDWLVDRRLSLGRAIEHRLDLDQADEAFRIADEANSGKVVFVWR